MPQECFFAQFTERGGVAKFLRILILADNQGCMLLCFVTFFYKIEVMQSSYGDFTLCIVVSLKKS